MLIRMADWERIRVHFTDTERTLLNEAVVGEAVCPRGLIVDEDKAGSVGVKAGNLTRELRDRDRTRLDSV